MMSDITVHRILNLIPFAQGKIRKIHIRFEVPLDQLISVSSLIFSKKSTGTTILVEASVSYNSKYSVTHNRYSFFLFNAQQILVTVQSHPQNTVRNQL